jgi:hypothetical protein
MFKPLPSNTGPANTVSANVKLLDTAAAADDPPQPPPAPARPPTANPPPIPPQAPYPNHIKAHRSPPNPVVHQKYSASHDCLVLTH